MKIGRHNNGIIVVLSGIEARAMGMPNVPLALQYSEQDKHLYLVKKDSGAKGWREKGNADTYRIAFQYKTLPLDWGTWATEEVPSKVIDHATHGKVMVATPPKRTKPLGNAHTNKKEISARKHEGQARKDERPLWTPDNIEPRKEAENMQYSKTNTTPASEAQQRPQASQQAPQQQARANGIDKFDHMAELLEEINALKDEFGDRMVLSTNKEGDLEAMMVIGGRRRAAT